MFTLIRILLIIFSSLSLIIENFNKLDEKIRRTIKETFKNSLVKSIKMILIDEIKALT